MVRYCDLRWSWTVHNYFWVIIRSVYFNSCFPGLLLRKYDIACSMLVTDVGDSLCWWQEGDIVDRVLTLQNSPIVNQDQKWFFHRYLSLYWKDRLLWFSRDYLRVKIEIWEFKNGHSKTINPATTFDHLWNRYLCCWFWFL